MKRIMKIMMLACVTLMMATGCSNNSKVSTISMDGSTSMEKVMGYLSESYMQENSDVNITYNPTGSSAGIQAVIEGRSDIGLSSRDLKDQEKEELKETVIAIDGIAIITNHQNPITNLSVEQLSRIFKGEITNWKEVNGNDAPIVCIGREAASGTRDGFEAITNTVNQAVYSQELTSTGDVIQTVSNNPNAIGYASIASVKDNVKMLTIDDISPSVETIQNGSYKIQRNFVIVTKLNSPLTETTQKFYDFVTSPAADSLIEKAGVVPVKR